MRASVAWIFWKRKDYMIGFLLGNWQRFAVYAALIALVLGMAELDGYRRGEKKLYEYQAEEATKAVAIVTKILVLRGAVTENVVTRYVKVRDEQKAAADEIKQEVKNYANTSACLDDDWRRLHDAAALGAIPGTAAPPDGEVRPAGADARGNGDDGAQRADYGY